MKSNDRTVLLSALYGRQAKLQVELELLEIGLELGDKPLLAAILYNADTIPIFGIAMVGMSRPAVAAIISEWSEEVLELEARIRRLERSQTRTSSTQIPEEPLISSF